MHVGDLRPAERAVELVQPGERGLGPLDRHAAAPGGVVARLVEHVHRHLAEAAAFVAVGGVERHREVMHPLGVPAEPFAARRRSVAGVGRRCRGAIVVALVFDGAILGAVGALPAGVAADGDARGAHDLILGHVEVHGEARELAVELARGHERVLLPAQLVVDHDLGIPLGEVEAAAGASLAARCGRGARVPAHVDAHRVTGQERPGKVEAHDRAVGREGIGRLDGLAHDPHVADMIEGEVRILEVVEPPPPLGRVHVGPPRPRAEGVEVEVEREGRQRVGRCVAVGDPLGAAQDAGGLVEPGGDLIGDVLLPVLRRGRGRGWLLQQQERQYDHGRLVERGSGATGGHRPQT